MFRSTTEMKGQASSHVAKTLFQHVLQISGGTEFSVFPAGSALSTLHDALDRSLNGQEIAIALQQVLPDIGFGAFLISWYDAGHDTFIFSDGVGLTKGIYLIDPWGTDRDNGTDTSFSHVYPIKQVLATGVIPAQVANSIDSNLRFVTAIDLTAGGEVSGHLLLLSKNKPGNRSQKINSALKHLLSAAFLSIRMTQIIKKEGLSEKISETEREQEKNILIAISNDMSAIRNKEDLLHVLHERLKKIFQFTHTLTTLSDENRHTYTGLIFDSRSISRKRHPDYQRICDQHYSWDDPMMKLVLASSAPVVFDLDDPSLQYHMPEWVRMNYECGIREVVMTILNSGAKHIGAFVIFSEEKNRFRERELSLIRGISSQLANAVANILANEEILAREQEKSTLLALSHEVSLIRNKEGLLNFFRYPLKKYLPINHVLICMMNSDERNYSTYFQDPECDCRGHKDYERISRTAIPLKDGISDKVFAAEYPVVWELKTLIGQPLAPEYLRMNFECGMNEVIFSPISIAGRKTGLLVIFTTTSKDFNKDSLRLIQGVSSQLSTSVTNIIANEKIERQFAEISEYKLQLEDLNCYLREEIQTNYNFTEIIGSSRPMQHIFHLVSQVAQSQSSVLILGETGTGKELIARAIHNASPRKDHTMVKVNCAALPVNLIESELFGHEKGSFTGATDRRIGKFELANNSTLFLDEIGELPLDLQAKLLRALQEREIERVGGRSVIKTNVRIIAATSRNLEKEVKEGMFRSDLYFRLNVFPITIPPLRDRKEDIPMLAAYFLAKYAKRDTKGEMFFSNKAIRELVAYSWPGNVRELEHMIERSVLLADDLIIKQLTLPNSTNKRNIRETNEETGIKTIEEVERDHILMVLEKTRGKIAGAGGAAELLSIPITTLASKMRKLGIRKKDKKSAE